MKVKVGTQLEDEVLRDLKVRAARDKKAMSDIIQEAVVSYLNDNRETIDRRDSLLRILENPVRLSDEEYRDVVESDYYDQ